MNPAEQTRWVYERASALGFDLCGIAPVGGLAELAHLGEWLACGHAGEMNYLHDPRRGDPRLVLDGARSIIVVALNYNSPQPYSTKLGQGEEIESARGWISRYAWGDDYHNVINTKLQALLSEMRVAFADHFEARAYVDTGPILERVAAKYAGLGWLGKNTCLINQQFGSWLFLGVIVTTLAFVPTLGPKGAPPADLCGSCTRCLDACPTQAFPEPYVLDARRCISYLTIELRGMISEELRASMGTAVIGCDICQDVCPWNRKAPITTAMEFHPRPIQMQAAEGDPSIAAGKDSLFAPALHWLASMTQADFSSTFRNSAVKRAKWRGLVRNACVALGNSRIQIGSWEYARALELLKNLAQSDDSVISDHAQWALARFNPDTEALISGNAADV